MMSPSARRVLRWLVLSACCVTGVSIVVDRIPAQAQEPEPIQVGEHDAVRLEALRQSIENGLPYIPGELLVKFKPGSEPRDQVSALAALRSNIRQNDARWIGDVLHLKNLDGDEPEAAAVVLRRQPEVLYAQPNYLRHLDAVPNDTNYSQQWQLEALNLPRAWDINPGGRADVTVAVIDSGLTTVSNTFQFRIWTGRAFQLLSVPFAKAADFDHSRVREGREFAFNWRWMTQAGEPVLFDADGHGTHVAGTIAQQTNNATGFAGVAYGTTILPLKVCWSYWDLQLVLGANGTPGLANPNGAGCPDDAQVQALRFAADNGAKIINMSVGGVGSAPAVAEALRYAVDHGAFVAIAAGNSGDKGNPTNYPAAYAPTIEGVVAVGSATKASGKAFYSSFGSYVELVAPGGDGASSANDIWQMAPAQSDLLFELLAPRFDRYQGRPMSGTSMAAPHVAGVAALLYSQGITKPAAIEAALKRFARDLGPSGRDDEFGYGLIDARAALRGMGVAK
jgi:serine protease